MYFIVWYVRLKKILEKHKENDSAASFSQLLRGVGMGKAPETIIKSPIQDPTQLSKLEVTTNIGRVQIKIFESHKKMMDFYSIINQGYNRNQPQ